MRRCTPLFSRGFLRRLSVSAVLCISNGSGGIVSRSQRGWTLAEGCGTSCRARAEETIRFGDKAVRTPLPHPSSCFSHLPFHLSSSGPPRFLSVAFPPRRGGREMCISENRIGAARIVPRTLSLSAYVSPSLPLCLPCIYSPSAFPPRFAPHDRLIRPPARIRSPRVGVERHQ